MSVVTLSLKGNPIGDAGGSAMGTMLRGNNTLVSLDLGGCGLETKSLISILLALLSHPALCAIKLDKPVLHSAQNLLSVVQHLAQTIARTTVLVDVSLEHFGLFDDHLATLLPPLVQNDSIKSLSLGGNKLTGDGGALLAKFLGRRPDIVNLSVPNNRLNDDGLAALATVVRTHPSLERLSLLGNGAGDRGLVAMAESVNASRSLRQVYVWGNKFGDAAAAAFYKHFTRMQALDYIDIDTYVVDEVPMISQRND
jgi:hypothetical protein